MPGNYRKNQVRSEAAFFLNIAHHILSVTICEILNTAERHKVTLWIKKLLGVKYDK